MHIYHRIARCHFLDGVVKKNWGSPLNLGKAWWHINNRFYSFAIYCTLMFFLCISSTCQRPWLSCNTLMPQRIDLSQNVLSGNGFHMEVLGTIAPSSYPALTCGLSTDPFSQCLLRYRKHISSLSMKVRFILGLYEPHKAFKPFCFIGTNKFSTSASGFRMKSLSMKVWLET